MPRINKTKFAILGILNLMPRSGYDIKKFCDTSFSHYWNENFSAIYPVLKRMEQDGLVTKKTEQNEGKPTRNIYSITEKGKNELFEWVLSPTEEQPVREEGLLKLAMGNANEEAQRELAIKLFEEAKEKNQRKLQECLDDERALIEEDPLFQSTGISFRLIALRCIIAITSAKITWCDESLEILKSKERRAP